MGLGDQTGTLMDPYISQFTSKLDELQVRLLDENRLRDARIVTDAANLIEDLWLDHDRLRIAFAKLAAKKDLQTSPPCPKSEN